MSADWLDEPWPELYRLTHASSRFPGLKFWGDVKELRISAGAYILVALDPNGDGVKRQTVHRLFTPDATGTLYIGATGNLAGRLGSLGNSILPDKRGKGHGLQRLRQLPWSERFPVESLAICWFYTTNRGKAHEREAHFAMGLYAPKFGERPPFDGPK